MTNGILQFRNPQWSPAEFASKIPQNTFLLICGAGDSYTSDSYQRLEDNVSSLNAIMVGEGRTLRLIFSHELKEKLAKNIFKNVGPDCKAMLILLSDSVITPKQSLSPEK
jgi:hypothetical protein